MASSSPLWPVLREEIRAAGRIPFSRFMELCLYHPQHGYYNSERVKLGAAGDFYTSAHVAPVFARILARHFEGLWRELGQLNRFDLVELGAGDGQFAIPLLPWIAKRFPGLFAHFSYTAIEQSAFLRGHLEERLKSYGHRVRSLGNLPEGFSESGDAEGICGCIFANEFFDALPVHLLIWRAGRWQEQYISLNGDQFVWCEGEPGSPALAQEAELRFDPATPLAEREEGWVAEVSPSAGQWIRRISQSLRRGEVLILDYGYTREEWQQGRFPQGSALAYRQHQVVNDLLSHPGEQDLTAHVPFTQLIEVGQQCGLRLRSFQSQAKFLLELGEPDEFHDVFADCASEGERLRRSQLLKTLILPQGMGEAFRVLRLVRD